MGEHHPLRIACGAAGVDDRGEVVWARRRLAFADEARAESAVPRACGDQTLPGSTGIIRALTSMARNQRERQIGQAVKIREDLIGLRLIADDHARAPLCRS